MWSLSETRSYVINMERNKDRWETFMAQPEASKIPNLQRFQAVDGSKIDVDNDPRISIVARRNIKTKTRRSHDMLDSKGGVGCALSHITLWQKLVASREPAWLILEDDVTIEEGDWATIKQLFSENKDLADTTKWDLWTVGNWFCNTVPDVIDPHRSVPENIWENCKEVVGLQAYFISRQGAEKLLREAFPIQQHIDWYISHFAQVHPLKIVHNKVINLGQTLNKPSEIADKEKCFICDVPTDFEKTHIFLPADRYRMLKIEEIVIATTITLGSLYFIMKHYRYL